MGSKNYTLLLLILVLSLFSCSDKKPVLSIVYPQMIYDVESEVLAMSIYGLFPSNSIRIEKIQVSHLESQIIWKCENPERIFSQDKKNEYVGYSAFLGIDNTFPSGAYEISFIDGTNQEIHHNFSLRTLSIEDVSKITKKEDYIGIYDENDIMVFAGKKDSKFSTEKKIKEKYPKAKYYRNMIKSKQTNIIYILEKKDIN